MEPTRVVLINVRQRMKIFGTLLFILTVARMQAVNSRQLDPTVYLGTPEYARIVAQATTVSAQAVVAWPSEEKAGTLEIRVDGNTRPLSAEANAMLKKLFMTRPVVPNVKYGCAEIYRIRLTFRHLEEKVEMLVLLEHGGFVVVDGTTYVKNSGGAHFPEAEAIFNAALLSAYSPDELKVIRKAPDEMPNQLPPPAPAAKRG